MFQSSRRCPAALRQLSHLSSLSSRCRISTLITSSVSRQAPTRHSAALLRLCPPTRHLHLTPLARQNAARPVKEDMVDDDGTSDDDMRTSTTFAELAEKGLVDPILVNTLTQRMKLETMTPVQTLTINEALTGKDVIAQAKTGTGKTIGFLLPIIQRTVEYDPSLLKRVHRGGNTRQPCDIRAIIISPTRELAEQIAVEAEKVTQDTGIIVQRAVGGTQKSFHLRKIQNEGCHILVATPGRLNDVLSDPATRVRAPKLNALVLDEADRLLDQGFYPEIQEIERALPDRREVDRQTMLFSATVPPQIVDLAKLLMKPDLHYVRTTSEKDIPTHQRVQQNMVEVPGMENVLPAVVELASRELETRQASADKTQLPFKAIIYFPTTAEVEMAAKILHALRWEQGHSLGSLSIFHIHSRLTQAQRTSAADHFRRAKSAILVSSDVTARGMDFPMVTHVIQCGRPQDRDSYIHRLGRTGRAGLEGQGWVILTRDEADDTYMLLGRSIPIKPNNSLETAAVSYGLDPDAAEPSNATPTTTAIFNAISRAAKRVPRETLSSAYITMLTRCQRVRNRALFVRSLNMLSRLQWGMQEAPYVPSAVASRLGLNHVKELNIRNSFNSSSDRVDYDRKGWMSDRDNQDHPSRGFGRGMADRSRDSQGGYSGMEALERAARQTGRQRY